MWPLGKSMCVTDHLSASSFYESCLRGTNLSTFVSPSHFRWDNLQTKCLFCMQTQKHTVYRRIQGFTRQCSFFNPTFPDFVSDLWLHLLHLENSFMKVAFSPPALCAVHGKSCKRQHTVRKTNATSVWGQNGSEIFFTTIFTKASASPCEINWNPKCLNEMNETLSILCNG